MKEDNKDIDYFQLIPKYLSGNANDSEVRLLEDWVLSSPKHKDQFNAFRNAWILSGIHQNDRHIDVDKEWQAIADHVFTSEEMVSLSIPERNRIPLWIKIAAAAAVLFISSFWLVKYLYKEKPVEVAVQDQVKEKLLPDGTVISLNQQTSIRYISGKGKKFRRIELTGDAFFEVSSDTARPFVISTQNIDIEVLGTAFYVDARADQSQIQVIVQSGSVSMSTETEKIVLIADEIGVYDKSSTVLHKKKNDDINYMAWKTELLVFENTPLEKVVFDLNRTFHSNISIAGPELKACEITAIYEHKSLEAIVKIIEKTLNIKAEIKDSEIIFSGQECT